MELQTKIQLVKYLETFITTTRRSRLEEVLQNRTRKVVAVLENIFQPQNASAVVRTCDCLGIQDLYIIEKDNVYRVNPKITLGSSQWVNLIRFSRYENNTHACITSLREQQYRIIGASPHQESFRLEELSLEGKLALLFGKEDVGLSADALDRCDEFVKIPMYGFTESYNLSVSAAIVLSHVMMRIRTEQPEFWCLSEEEKIDLKLTWLRKMIRRHDLHEAEFFARGMREKNG